MIGPGTGVRVYLACGVTDMRKGINGLSALAQDVLRQRPTGGAVFAFRGRRGDRIKLLYWDGQGFCLYYKVLEKGRFPWPKADDGAVRLAKGVTVAKPVYAAQIALYQAYMEASVPGISANSALFTAINKDTAELHHELVPFDAELAQRMSDRAVRILRATDAGDLLPRIATSRDFFECRFCPWAERCWGLPG